MNSCDEIRELLSLAASRVLDADTENRVARHASECRACAIELERWRDIARALRRVPTPQPAAGIVERARARAGIALAQQVQRRQNRNALILVTAFAWTTILVSWPVVRFLTGYLQVWFATSAAETWHVFAGIMAAGWVAGGVAAAALASHQTRERRLA